MIKKNTLWKAKKDITCKGNKEHPILILLGESEVDEWGETDYRVCCVHSGTTDLLGWNIRKDLFEKFYEFEKKCNPQKDFINRSIY